MPGSQMMGFSLNGLLGSLTEMGAQQRNLEFRNHDPCTCMYMFLH